jgi:RNA polymerase sigma-70 factor (ECF subfamily)
MPSRPAYFERLLRLLRRKGRSHEDAEDLIQEAMLRLHVYGRESTVANEEAFLRHAVHNLSIDQHRRDRGGPARQIPIEDVDPRQPLVAAEANPEERLDAHQRLNRIRRILDAVNPRTREIYFAHRAGYSYTEIAGHLGVSHITIKRHIARALLTIMEHGDADPHGKAQR